MATKRIGLLTSGGDAPDMSRLESGGISLDDYNKVLKMLLVKGWK